jgi:hypothetical protein
MCAKSKPKLLVELVPSTCHFSNVRTTVSTKEWDKIRHISYEAANHVCEICSDTGKNQGYKHNVECHEIWHYDDKKHIQKLVGLISLCPTCHQVKHIGRAIAIGKQNEAIGQLLKVNKWTPEEAAAHIAESFELYKERSKFQWILDISILKKEPYSITIKETKKRIFEVKKYKKKRKPTAKKVVKKPTKRPPKK